MAVGIFLLQLRRHVTHGLEQTIKIEAGLRGRKNHRRVIQKKQSFLHPFAELSKSGQQGPAAFTPHLFIASIDFFFARFANALLDQIPLFTMTMQAFRAWTILSATFLSCSVMPASASKTRTARSQRIIDSSARLTLKNSTELPTCRGFAHTRRVNQYIGLARARCLDLKGNIDRIASGSWNGADDDPFGLSEGIDDGRLAHIGPTDNREL